MNELEQWVIVGLLVLLCTLVIALWDSVRDLKRSLAHTDDILGMVDKNLTQRYWDNAHNITLIFEYLGVYVDEPKATRKLVKKGSPERGA